MKPNEPLHFLVKLTYIILLVLLLPACSLLATPTAVLEDPPLPLAPTGTAALPTVTSAPTGTPASTPTTAAPTATAVPDAASVSVSFGGLEMNFTAQVVEAVPPSPDVMGYMVMPKHLRLELQNYAITEHLKKPQIYVYVVEELAINEAAAQAAASLQAVLANPASVQQMSQEQDLPFLPLINEAQMLHAQVQFVDFKNGQGVRYVTQYSQGLTPITNAELFYTFQGLTSDGKYYIAAVLPVNLPGLPADAQDTGMIPLESSTNYSNYLLNTLDMLNQQPVDAFTPDLSILDATLQAMEIR